MSLTSKNNPRYPNNPSRTHGDFGQAGGYPQQYAYATAPMQAVQSNTPHDMSKQVATAQPGMFPNSGGMAAQQHHQSMGGPVPNPQPATLVQQGQQIRGNHMSMTSFYSRGSVPRQIPNMGRTQIPTVVNQAGQQPASQYSHLQVLPTPFTHAMPQVIVNHQFPPVYQQRAFSPPQNLIFPAPTSQVYVNNHWGNYSNPPQASSNGYYPSHAMPAYNPMPPAQQMPPPIAQTQKKTKAIAIIDPNTGKNILDGMNEDDTTRPIPDKESENSDQSLGVQVQFAAQVAATLGEKTDSLSKTSSIEDNRVLDSQNICCEMDPVHNVEPEDSELGDVESLADLESVSDIENIEVNRNIECLQETSCFKKEVDNENINDSKYESEKTVVCVMDQSATIETRDSYTFSNLPVEKSSVMTDEITKSSNLSKPGVILETDNNVGGYKISDAGNNFVQLSDSIPIKTNLDSQSCVPITNINIDESKAQEHIDLPETVSTSSNQSSKTGLEGKRGKAKKKRDYSKKGESKDGGEMDAFLDKREDVSEVPVSVPTAPFKIEEQPQSPAFNNSSVNVDSEILSNIPLGDEASINVVGNEVLGKAPLTDGVPVNIDDNEIIGKIPLHDESPVTIVDNEILSKIPLPDEVSPTEQPSSETSVSPTGDSEDKENIDESAQNKMKLKYSYKEDQWSPLNPEGKKQYDRDFLLQLQSQPMSMTKPLNLPNLDVIKDKAHIQKLNEINRAIQMPPTTTNFRDHFLPTFARGQQRIPAMNFNNRRSLQGRESKTKKVISLSQNVKLHEADNAWKPASKQEIPAEEKEKLKRSVQGILNKLTPQKFETLLTQLKGLNIDTEEKLTIVIDLIFEKAVDEPNFSVPYANMCKHLAMIKVPIENQKFVNFRKLLLTKCQKEFEQDRTDEMKHEERVKALEAADPEKKKELEQEMYDEEKKMRYRQLGNIRFIGELFKLGMLIEPIMHECIKRLLSQGDEESLECLCRLLKTIGKELDEGKNKNTKESMECYFTEMQKIVDKRLTSSRVRFMLQDVIDLKKNNWVPRRDENNPKTIDQIHKEAEREAREQQQVLQNMSFNKRIPDDRDRRKSTARNQVTSEEGWTSSTKSSKGSYSIVDPNKLKLTKPDEVDSIRLGPGRAMQSWGRGSSGGTKTQAGSSDPDKTTLTNRYSALAEQSTTPSFAENRRGSQRSAASSRESSRGRNTQLPPNIRKTPSTSKERDNAIEAVKGLVRSTTPGENKAVDRKKSPEPQLNGKGTDSTELKLKGVELNDEQMEKKTKPLIDEFLHNNDFEEAVRCVTELASPSTIHMFINLAINQVLERSSQARHSLGQLLISLVKQNIITFEHYKKGFACVLEYVDDFALDIPMIWDYLGEILEPMLEDNKYPLSVLKEVLVPCIPSETAGMLVSSTLHSAAKKRGTIKLGELWRESSLLWSDFLGEKANVQEFIQKHKLEFTVCSTKSKPITPMSTEEIKKHLLDLLTKKDESEEIFDWIDANVPENTEPSFIRALVSAVHENAIKDSGTACELDVNKLKKRISILTRYIDHNENLELQALYAIQSLMNQLNQPKGILRQIFDILYDDDVITEESFKNWEQSDDENEAEGKGVALHSVKSFFTWLKETDSGDSGTDE